MSGHPIVQKKLNLRASDVRGDFRLNVDLDIRLDGITAIFGRSGAGKSSLLRLIAGLDQIEDAHVQMGEQIWQCQSSKVWVPAHKRQIGYIFQTPGLFEHLSVQGNLDYAAKRASARYPVDMALLGVDQLLHRRVSGLSGGERQRVALARALVSNPGMLLMDEPVSALDNQSKEQVLILIQELQRSTAIPVLYVSHSVDEVARISDWLVLLREGRVIAQGKTLEMLTHPEIAQDSDVLETVVEAEVVALDEDYGLCRLRFPGGDLWVANSRLKSGEKTRARIMARDVSLTLERQVNTSIQNVLPARIVDIRVPSKSNAGLSQVVIELDISGCRLLALLTRRSVDQLTLSKGKRVFAQIKSVALLS